MIEEFQFNRKLLSSFYIASLFSFMVFELMTGFVRTLVNNLASFLGNSFGFNFQNPTNIWLVFFFLCFIFTLFIRRFVVRPLGFFSEPDDAPWWDLALFAFLVLGFYVFMLNQTFAYAMPSEYLNSWFVKLFGGYKNTYLPNTAETEESLSGWTFIKAFWYLTPILYLWIRTKVNISTD